MATNDFSRNRPTWANWLLRPALLRSRRALTLATLLAICVLCACSVP